MNWSSRGWISTRSCPIAAGRSRFREQSTPPGGGGGSRRSSTREISGAGHRVRRCLCAVNQSTNQSVNQSPSSSHGVARDKDRRPPSPGDTNSGRQRRRSWSEDYGRRRRRRRTARREGGQPLRRRPCRVRGEFDEGGMERSGGVWVGLETASKKKPRRGGDAERGGEISQGGGRWGRAAFQRCGVQPAAGRPLPVFCRWVPACACTVHTPF